MEKQEEFQFITFERKSDDSASPQSVTVKLDCPLFCLEFSAKLKKALKEQGISANKASMKEWVMTKAWTGPEGSQAPKMKKAA